MTLIQAKESINLRMSHALKDAFHARIGKPGLSEEALVAAATSLREASSHAYALADIARELGPQLSYPHIPEILEIRAKNLGTEAMLLPTLYMVKTTSGVEREGYIAELLDIIVPSQRMVEFALDTFEIRGIKSANGRGMGELIQEMVSETK